MASSEDLNVLSICVEILESLDAGSAKRISDFLQHRFSNEPPTSTSTIGKKKRGRPAKKKRGKPAKTASSSTINGVELSTITEKKRRGRPAKKKRGRPAKVVVENSMMELGVPVEKKRRGRPAKKRRGRPAKSNVDLVIKSSGAKRKRGRPAKNA